MQRTNVLTLGIIVFLAAPAAVADTTDQSQPIGEGEGEGEANSDRDKVTCCTDDGVCWETTDEDCALNTGAPDQSLPSGDSNADDEVGVVRCAVDAIVDFTSALGHQTLVVDWCGEPAVDEGGTTSAAASLGSFKAATPKQRERR
jgi:hypothetical protein